VIGSFDIIEYLVECDEIKILPYLKDKNGGSFNDLKNLIHLHPIDSSPSLQKLIFEKITKTKFLQKEIKLSQKDWIRCWKKNEIQKLTLLEQEIQKEYKKFKKNKKKSDFISILIKILATFCVQEKKFPSIK
jgi:hypothetical protein